MRLPTSKKPSVKKRQAPEYVKFFQANREALRCAASWSLESLRCLGCGESFAEQSPLNPIRVSDAHFCEQCAARDSCKLKIPLHGVSAVIGSADLVPGRTGYVIGAKLDFPKCPVCNEEFGFSAERLPVAVTLAKVLCTTCHNNSTPKPSRCLASTQFWLEFLIDFARAAFSRRTFQDLGKPAPSVDEDACQGSCGKSFHYDDLLFCADCQAIICGLCQFKAHRNHKEKLCETYLSTVRMLDEKVKQMKEGLET
ncbi:unnamed protein product, partial [Mesorhabditis spiculigera]